MRNIPSKKTLMAQIRDSEKTGHKTNDTCKFNKDFKGMTQKQQQNHKLQTSAINLQGKQVGFQTYFKS